jgi:hypothetical protein
MKVRILMLFFVLPFTLPAQQWQPVSSSEKFNFRIDTANIITTVIGVDSAQLLNGDSVYYLNRVVRKCTGCPEPGSYLCNQPQFLLKEMIMKPGGLYVFKNPGSFLLKTLAEVNESWIFDTAAALSAQVTSKAAVQVFGQWDSVKTISLSNNQVIKLSKDHGIIQFPVIGQVNNYLLEGIAGRNAGLLLPGFMGIYHYQVGDVFQYKYEWMSFAMGNGGKTLLKQRIISRDSTLTGYSYLVEQCSKWWDVSSNGIPGPAHHQYQITTINYTDSATGKLNHFPGQLVRNPLDPSFTEPFVSGMTIRKDTGQTTSRIIGGPGFALCYDDGSDTLSPANGAFNYFSNEFTTGLGEVAYIENGFEWYNYMNLIGYVKNGDTTGIVYPDDFILQKVPASGFPNRLTIYPNPARDVVHVQIPENDRKPVVVELYGSGGKLVRRLEEQVANSMMRVDISGLPPGLYLLMVKTPGNSMSRKLVVE